MPVAIAEKTVVANALESLGKCVKKKPADELFGIQRHGLLLAVVAVIFPLEPDLAIFDVQEAMVGDGYTMRIAAHIVEHLLRSGKRRLGVNHPFRFPDRRQVTSEFLRILKCREGVEDPQLAGLESLIEIFQK